MAEANRYQSWMRMLQILEYLKAEEQTVAQLADKLGCSDGALRRDLGWLNDNLDSVKWRKEGRSKVYFCEEEELHVLYPAAFALLLSEQAMESFARSGVRGGIQDLLLRARGIVGGEPERKVIGIAPHFELSEEQQECFDTIVQAIREHCWIELSYTRPGDPPRPQILAPLSLVFYQSRLYIIVLEGDETSPYQLRRLDRVESARLCSPKRKFEYPAEDVYQPRALFRHSFGPFPHNGLPKEPIVLRFYGRAAEQHRHHKWPVPFEILEHDPLTVELHAHPDGSFRHFVLRLGAGVEVLSPQEVRAGIGRELAAGAGRYQEH